MGIVEALREQHTASFMTAVLTDAGAPQLSRMAVLDYANHIAAATQDSDALKSAIFKLENAIHKQLLSQETAKKLQQTGWPQINGCPNTEANLFYAAGRLSVHAALSGALTSSTQATALAIAFPSTDELTSIANEVAEGLEPGFVDSVLSATADQLLADTAFAQRIAAAAQDCGQLFTGGEIPHYLQQLLAEHEVNSGGSSTRNLVPEHNPALSKRWGSALANWYIPPVPVDGVRKDDEGDGGDGGGWGDGGADGTAGGVGAGAVLCSIGGIATGGALFVICVAVVVGVVIYGLVRIITGKH